MPRNEDGELELVLGNTQLLSFFFVVVGLLGVFFAMGYWVGRTSAPVTVADARPVPATGVKPIVVESSAETPAAETLQEAKPKPFETPSPSGVKAPKETASAKPQPITTAPQQSVETPAQPEPLSTAKEDSKKERPSQPREKRDKKGKLSGIGEAAAGRTYLQLSATKRAEAETYVDVLKKKGFPAIAARVPEKGDMYRVLVGPVADADLNKTKTELQRSGFPGEKALRKKF